MNSFQVKAALDNAFYFLSILAPNRLRPGPLTEKPSATVRERFRAECALWDDVAAHKLDLK